MPVVGAKGFGNQFGQHQNCQGHYRWDKQACDQRVSFGPNLRRLIAYANGADSMSNGVEGENCRQRAIDIFFEGLQSPSEPGAFLQLNLRIGRRNA